MALIGYIRVSSVGQSLDVQRDKMTAIGVQPDHLFEEKKSGVDTNRPALKEALRFARKGDVFLCIENRPSCPFRHRSAEYRQRASEQGCRASRA
ncbi:recombinase family protein [Sinorhizobium psoraleae]|uniref:recombinase family protein n=1 Tax=Sinorhizobium psoraleae TaxID=520838 RepID=UPI00289830F5|nr:recombinase family protein [Sinorhizobium psoraleae]